MSELKLGAPFLARCVREKWGFFLPSPTALNFRTQPILHEIGEDDRMASVSVMRILQQSSVVRA